MQSIYAQRVTTVKAKISEIDKLINSLVNKRQKSETIKKINSLPLHFQDLLAPLSGVYVDDLIYTRSNTIQSIAMVAGEEIGYDHLVYLRSPRGMTPDMSHLDEETAFKINNSFEWAVSDLRNHFHGLSAFPAHTRDHVKKIEISFKRPHGVKLPWDLVPYVHPVLTPARSLSVPGRPRNAPYRHKSNNRRTWTGEDLIVFPALVKIKLLRSDLSGLLQQANDDLRKIKFHAAANLISVAISKTSGVFRKHVTGSFDDSINETILNRVIGEEASPPARMVLESDSFYDIVRNTVVPEDSAAEKPEKSLVDHIVDNQEQPLVWPSVTIGSPKIQGTVEVHNYGAYGLLTKEEFSKLSKEDQFKACDEGAMQVWREAHEARLKTIKINPETTRRELDKLSDIGSIDLTTGKKVD